MTRPRSRATAKAAGSKMERAVANYLATHIDDRIDRRVKTGGKDKGDIASFRLHGKRAVIEVKWTKDYNIGPHLGEAEVERINDDALVGMVVQKRPGIGIETNKGIGSQLVTMTLRDLVALITGARPTDEEPEPDQPEF